jgi:hypothetical protein
MVLSCLEALDEAFGHSVNSKGHKVLNTVRGGRMTHRVLGRCGLHACHTIAMPIHGPDLDVALGERPPRSFLRGLLSRCSVNLQELAACRDADQRIK